MTQKEKHMQAFEKFALQIKDDPNVIVFLLYGSLVYGTVSETSDIDLVILVRDGSIKPLSQDWVEYTVEVDDIEIHIGMYEISKFKRRFESLQAGNWTRSQYSKGMIMYCKDDSFIDFFESIRIVGKDEAIRGFIRMLEYLCVGMTRARKWITTLDDDLYAQNFIQSCSWPVSEMVVLLNSEHPDREARLRAMELNPKLMHEVFIKPTTTVMSKDDIWHALRVLDNFLMEHVHIWSKPILDFFSDGEMKTLSECDRYFGFEMGCAISYLVQKGFLYRVSKQSRLFKNSKLTIEETAFMYIKEEHDNE